jgi:chromate transporter
MKSDSMEITNKQTNLSSQTYAQLFLRFLRFGCLAWGGPVAQIAMIRQELVDEERWVSPERFNRALALYQAIPGPEAHELCVYFGMIARGRFGGFLAGLGFMLPGLLLVLLLAWVYLQWGLSSALFAGLLYGMQPAVGALIVRAVHRLGQHALRDHWLLGIAVWSLVASFLNVSFWITLPLAGLFYLLAMRKHPFLLAFLSLWVIAIAFSYWQITPSEAIQTIPSSDSAQGHRASLNGLFWSGLQAGLLSFGGAYTAIPLLQHNTVEANHWVTNAQFLDSIAFSGMLPSPLIIFATFIGFLAGGLGGALAMTAGVFLPAFGFTLLGHHYLEKLITRQGLHTFLDGLMAGVIGLIALTGFELLRATLTDFFTLAIGALALIALYRWKSKATVLIVILCAGLLGVLIDWITKL